MDSKIIIFIALLIGAYFLGAVPMAYIVAKGMRGIDLRHYGSGNVGASNVVASVGKGWGALVIAFDLGKGALAVLMARLVGLDLILQIAVGIAAIVGHNWPIFLGFSGGRGILATLGVAFMMAPLLTLIFLLLALFMGLFKQLSLGTLIAIAGLPAGSFFFPGAFGISSDHEIIALGFTAILLLTIVRRLAVPRAPIAASLGVGEVLGNRLLFDRDIRDRETWVHRDHVTKEGTSQ